jgi:hypothetical protein
MNNLLALTGLNSDCQSIIIEYAADQRVVALADPKIQTKYYKDLTKFITLFANSFTTIDRFEFPPLYDRQIFAETVAKSLKTIINNAGISVKDSELNLPCLLKAAKHSTKIYSYAKEVTIGSGFIIGALFFSALLFALGAPTTNEILATFQSESKNLSLEEVGPLAMEYRRSEMMCGESYATPCFLGVGLGVITSLVLGCYVGGRDSVIRSALHFFNSNAESIQMQSF